MACCWDPAKLQAQMELKYWAADTGGWLDLARNALNLGDLLSGSPEDILVGGQELYEFDANIITAFGITAAAFSQYISGVGSALSTRNYHHHGLAEYASYLRTDIVTRRGGLVPVLYFIVPSYYMRYVTPTYYNKFQFGPLIKYDGDINIEVPAQVHDDDPYYADWERWKQNPVGVPDEQLPDSISEDDIDIVLKWIHYDDIHLYGGSIGTRTQVLSNFGGVMVMDIRNDYPHYQPDGVVESVKAVFTTHGFITPRIFVRRDEYLMAQAGDGYDFVGAAQTAGPFDTMQGISIEQGIIERYPAEDAIYKLYINGELFPTEEWTDEDIINLVYDRFRYIPVQTWSSPSDFQNGGM